MNEENVYVLGASKEAKELDLKILSDEQEIAPTTHNSSSKVLVGLASSASGDLDSGLKEYRELVDQGYEEDAVLDIMTERVRDETSYKNIQAVEDILLDPQLPDDLKKEIVQKVQNNIDDFFSLEEEVLTQALSEEKEEPRFDAAKIVREVNAYKKSKQEDLNAFLVMNDPNTASKVLDFFELLVPFLEQKFVGGVVSSTEKGSELSYLKSIFAMGTSKENLREAFLSLDLEARESFRKVLLSSIENEHIGFDSKNSLLIQSLANDILSEEDYSTGSKWVDNAISILDLTVFGGLIRRGSSSARKSETFEEFASRMNDVSSRFGARFKTRPTSPAGLVDGVAPAKRKEFHKKIVEDETEETAQALYGTTRQEAIVDDILPDNDTSVVRDRPDVADDVEEVLNNPVKDIDLDERVAELIERQGLHHLSDEDIASSVQKLKDILDTPKHVVPRTRMQVIENTPVGAKVTAYYGPTEMGWTDAAEALKMTAFALRDLGVTPDDLEVVYKTSEGSYVPVAKENIEGIKQITNQGISLVDETGVTLGNEILVRYKTDYVSQLRDIESLTPENVSGWNLFDRFSFFQGKKQGSFTRHYADPATLFKDRLAMSGFRAVDRAAEFENRLMKVAKEYSDIYSSLSSKRKSVIDAVIKKDNLEKRPFNKARYQAEGIVEEQELKALKAWRNIQDNLWYLDNRDLRQSLRDRGFRLIQTGDKATRLLGKPMRKQDLKTLRVEDKIYDPVMDEFVNLSRSEIEEIYEQGGNISVMRSPQTHKDTKLEHVIVRETPDTAYSRSLNDNDNVLAYTEGYFSVYYNAPYFIDEIVRNSKGEVLYKKAVAVAGDSLEAEKLRAYKSSGKNSDDFIIRKDVKEQRELEDIQWELQSAANRASHKVRGKRLDDGNLGQIVGEHLYVDSPAESLVRSVRSISRRTSVREWLDASKKRFLEQYGDIVTSEQYGRKIFPNNPEEIGIKGVENKRVADARTTYEYIKYMEEGYVNLIDESFKAFVNVLSHSLGQLAVKADSKALASAERMSIQVANSQPLQKMKGASFQMLLVGNPLRQLVVQGHQAVMLHAAFFDYTRTSAYALDTSMLLMHKMGFPLDKRLFKKRGITEKQFYQMVKEYEESGLSSAIDKNNLMRGSLADLIEEQSMLGIPVVKQAAKILTLARKIGFDAGEEINMLTSWVAHRDRKTKEKGSFDLNVRDIEDVSARARNFTLGMNSAGDMPYNHNMLTLPLHFQQVTHKTLLLMTGNQHIPRETKVKLALFYSVMFGIPGTGIYALIGPENLPENEELRALMVQGLESYSFNTTLGLVFDQDVNLDFSSSLAPMEVHGTYVMLEELFKGNLEEAFLNSPTGGLFFRKGGPVQNLLETANALYNPDPMFKGESTNLADLTVDFFKLFSGVSNAYKAAYALKEGQKIAGPTSAVTDDYVESVEALATTIGIGTEDEKVTRWINGYAFVSDEDLRKDVNEWVDKSTRILNKQGLRPEEIDHYMTLIGGAWKVFSDNPKARDLAAKRIMRNAKKGDVSMNLIETIMRLSSHKSNSEVRALLDNMPKKRANGEDFDTQPLQDILKSLDEVNKEEGK